MKMNVIRSEKNLAEFELEGERHTFPNLLREKLMEDKNVENVSYILEHPMDKHCKFIIKTKSKAPKTVLKDAVKEVSKELGDFEKSVKKAMK